MATTITFKFESADSTGYNSDAPVRVEVWWNRSEQAWVVESFDAENFALGFGSDYLGNCGKAFALAFAADKYPGLPVEHTT